MKTIILIGNRANEHVHVPAEEGVTERDGGHVAWAERAFAGFDDWQADVITSGIPSWTDVHLDRGGETTAVTNAPVRIRGMRDADVFYIAPITANEFSFDQMDLLNGKIVLNAEGVFRVLNSSEKQPFTLAERFHPLIDVVFVPWQDRELLPAAALKEWKKHRVALLMKHPLSVDVYVRGEKTPLSRDRIGGVAPLGTDDLFLATFTAHYFRTNDALLAANAGLDAVTSHLTGPDALKLPDVPGTPKPVVPEPADDRNLRLF